MKRYSNLEFVVCDSQNIDSIAGNATNLLAFADRSFEITFSNSEIEDLFNFENQQKMATEALRVSKNHFIQTPNYWFPIELHWVFPFFQIFPKIAKTMLTRDFTLGYLKKSSSWALAKQQVEEIQLLSKSDMKKLFLTSKIWEENLFALIKSFVAHNF